MAAWPRLPCSARVQLLPTLVQVIRRFAASSRS
jgi:hypothetical protein